jgi:hypothetical protein
MNLSDSDFLIRFTLAIFTCYRLARLVAKDDGPLFWFKRVRYWAKDRAWYEAGHNNMLESESGARVVNGKKVATISDRHYGKWHSLAEALECPYCLGVWLSIPLSLFVIYPMTVTDLFMLLMTISGVQAWLWGMANK